MKIDVLMVTYNQEQYVKQAIDGILMQQLNKGVTMRIVVADDALMPNALELENRIHIANAKVSIVYSKVYYCDIDYTIRAYGESPIIKNGETYLDHRSHGPMNFASYKNEFYHKTAGINPNLKAAIDQDLYFRLEEVGEIYLLDEYTYKYVNVGHEHAISASNANYISAWYWNMVARRDAFIRRKKSEEPLVEDFKAYFDAYLENQLRKNEGEQIDRIVKKRFKTNAV